MCYDYKAFAAAYAPQILKDKLKAAIAQYMYLTHQRPISVEAIRAQKRIVAKLQDQVFESGFARSPQIPKILRKQAW